MERFTGLPSVVRQQSLAMLTALKLPEPKGLPLLDEPICSRSVEEVTNRLLCLHAVAATSYGLDRQKAFIWLQNEGLENSMTEKEKEFIGNAHGNPLEFQLQVESLWALAWALRIIPTFDVTRQCDSTFFFHLPNLKQNQRAEEIRSNASLRTVLDIMGLMDKCYCLHWVAREYARNSVRLVPVMNQVWIISERRRAFQWILFDEDWDDASLDT